MAYTPVYVPIMYDGNFAFSSELFGLVTIIGTLICLLGMVIFILGILLTIISPRIDEEPFFKCGAILMFGGFIVMMIGFMCDMIVGCIT